MRIAVLLAVLFSVVCASPYVTAWKDFGHPFYPMCTADAEKHPVQSMAGDFLVANDDWKEMGPIGFFANAYVSPVLTQIYYRWKLKRDEFRPVCATWVFSKDHSPLSLSERMRIWGVLLALLFCVRTRPLAIMAICGLAFVPPYLYGLMRYFWWMQFLMYFVLFEYARRLEGLQLFHLNCFAQVLGGLAVCYFAYRPTQAMLQSYRNRAEMDDFRPQRAYCQIYPPYQLEKFDLSTIPNEGDRKLMQACHGTDDSDSGSHLAINNVKLLARRWANLSKTEIVPTRKNEARRKKFTKLGFYVD